MQRRIRLLQQKHVDTATLDVRWWGAQGDGVTDDTPAIRAAVAARKALGPGTVYFPRPAVAYVIQPQAYAYSPTFPFWTGCIDIDFGDVTFRGDPGGSTLRLRTYGGGNPDTDFSLIYRNSVDAGQPPGIVPPQWQANHNSYAANAMILANGHFYITFAGGISGPTMPSFTTSPGKAGNITDGGVIWALWDYTWRGNMFRIKSFATGPALGIGNILFRDLIFDGGAPYRADMHGAVSSMITLPRTSVAYDRLAIAAEPMYPAGTLPAGQGWCTGHRAVEMPAPFTYGDITYENCTWTGWRAECVYASQGSGLAGKVTIRGKSRITDCTADGLSFTAPCLVEDMEIDHTPQAIECDPISYDNIYRRVHIHDCSVGITMPSNYPNYLLRGKTLIEDCTLERASHFAVLFNGFCTNVTFRRNRLIDCNTLFARTSAGAIWVYDSLGGSPKNILISDCDFICDAGAGRGMIIATAAVASSGNRVERCRFTQTSRAVNSGNRWSHSVQIITHASSEWTVVDCDCRGATNAPQAYGPGSTYDPLPVRIERCRTEGLAFEAPIAPYLDPRGYLDFTVAPAAPVVLTAARGFVVGAPTRIVISGNVTVLGSATLVLAAAGPWAPPAPGGESVFVRPAASPDKVFELPGARMGYT